MLTEAQWRWVEQGHPSVLRRFIFGIRNFIIYYLVIVAIIYSLFFTDDKWPKNLVVAASVVYFVWMLLVTVVIWVVASSLENDTIHKMKLDGLIFNQKKGLRTVIYRPWTLGYTYFIIRRIHWLILEYGIMVSFIAYGWVMWGLTLVICNIISDIGYSKARKELIKYISKCSPTRLRKIDGSENSYIVSELVKSIGVVSNIEIKTDDGGSDTSITFDGIPQSTFVIRLTQDTISLTERRYSLSTEHLCVDLSDPISLDTIENILRTLHAERSAEAKE